MPITRNDSMSANNEEQEEAPKTNVEENIFKQEEQDNEPNNMMLIQVLIKAFTEENTAARKAMASESQLAREHTTDLLFQQMSVMTEQIMTMLNQVQLQLQEKTTADQPSQPNNNNVHLRAGPVKRCVNDIDYEFFRKKLVASFGERGWHNIDTNEEVQDQIMNLATSLVLEAITRTSRNGTNVTYPFGISQLDVQNANARQLLALMDSAFKDNEENMININLTSFTEAAKASPRTFEALTSAWQHLNYVLTRARNIDAHSYTYKMVLDATDALFNNYLSNTKDAQVNSAVRTQMHSMQAKHLEKYSRDDRHEQAATLITAYGKSLLTLARPRNITTTTPTVPTTKTGNQWERRKSNAAAAAAATGTTPPTRTTVVPHPAAPITNGDAPWSRKCYHCNRIGQHDAANCPSPCNRCKGRHPGVKYCSNTTVQGVIEEEEEEEEDDY